MSIMTTMTSSPQQMHTVNLSVLGAQLVLIRSVALHYEWYATLRVETTGGVILKWFHRLASIHNI